MIYLARTSSPPQIPPPRKRSDGFDSFGSDEKLQNFAGFSGASSSNNLLVPAFLPFNELIQKINTSRPTLNMKNKQRFLGLVKFQK